MCVCILTYIIRILHEHLLQRLEGLLHADGDRALRVRPPPPARDVLRIRGCRLRPLRTQRARGEALKVDGLEDVRCVDEDCIIVHTVYALFSQILEKIKIGVGAPKSIDFPQALRIAPSYEVCALKSCFLMAFHDLC